MAGQVIRNKNSSARHWCLDKVYQQTMRPNLTLGPHESYVLAASWSVRMEYVFQCCAEGLFATRALATAAMERSQESEALHERAHRGAVGLGAEIQRIRDIVSRL